jgi:hypothetical protein
MRKGRKEITRQLRSLGGRKARLKNHNQANSELLKVEMFIAYLRCQMKNRHIVKRLAAQLPWHYVAVPFMNFFTLPEKRKGLDIRNLRDWLSIPKLDLKCRRQTIKAARKRMVFIGLEQCLGEKCRHIVYHSGKNDNGAGTDLDS